MEQHQQEPASTDTRPGVWKSLLETAVMSLVVAGFAALSCVLISRSKTSSMVTIESAMNGMLRVGAVFSCLACMALAVLLLIVIAVRQGLKKRSFACAVLPLLTIAPIYLVLQYSCARIERTPEFIARCTESAAALDALCAAVRSGSRPNMPSMAGRFRIIEYEQLSNGGLVLYTTHQGREAWGFVYNPTAPGDSKWASQVGISGKVGDYAYVKQLRRGWFLLFDGYTFAKRGWS